MRRLLIGVLILVALWAGYWFAAARLLERGADGWFAAQAEAGMLAEHDGLRVTGFPLGFRLDVTRPHLANPETAAGWSAPQAQVFARSWMPWRVALDLPEQQRLTLPGQEVAIRSSTLTARLGVSPQMSLPLDRIEIAGDGLSLQSSKGWSLGIARLSATTQRAEADPLTHDLRIEATLITPDDGFRQRLAPISSLPALIDGLLVDAALAFDAPLDRNAATTQPHLTGLMLRDAKVTWGALVLSAFGTVTPDANGLATGQIDLRVTGWREVVPVLVAARLITPEVAPTVTRALEVMAKDSTAEVLALPLVLADGWMRLGPIPLGPAPVMLVQRQ